MTSYWRSDEELKRLGRDVTAVIPLFGKTPKDLALLVRQLQKQSVGEIIISASNVSDLPQLDGVTIMSAKRRLTPSSAKNRAAYSSSKQFLLFIDADNHIGELAIATMRETLEDGNVAIAAAATYFQEDSDRVCFLGASHRHWAGLTKFLTQVSQEEILSSPNGESPRRVLIEVAANAYMMRRADFITVGGFDEVAFPSHFEESDLSYRIRKSTKVNIVCCIDARVYNDIPLKSSKRLSAKDPLRSYFNARSRTIFTARHLGIRAWLLYVIAGQFGFCLVYVWSEISGHGSVRGRLHSIVGYGQGMIDGMLLSRHELRVSDSTASR